MEFHKLDLHTHSCLSDGTFRPAEIVRLASEAGISLLALTDHDGLQGVAEAREAAAQTPGLTFFPSVEMDTEFPEELHILGLDLNPDDAALTDALSLAAERRQARNEKILDKLAGVGCDVRPFLDARAGIVTRMHIAHALCDGGFARDTKDAFARYLRPGRPGYASVPRFTPEEVIRLILRAGGVPVLAHPCHLRCNVHRLVAELAEYGLMGVEVYYPAATPGQIEQHAAIARQHGLLMTCGSDFHGANRPTSPLGCAYRPVQALEDCCQFFINRHKTPS